MKFAAVKSTVKPVSVMVLPLLKSITVLPLGKLVSANRAANEVTPEPLRSMVSPWPWLKSVMVSLPVL